MINRPNPNWKDVNERRRIAMHKYRDDGRPRCPHCDIFLDRSPGHDCMSITFQKDEYGHSHGYSETI